jgi:aspartate aminotransferase
MAQQLSDRIQRIKPSATFAVAAKAALLKEQGQDVIDLSVGEPDFDTPDYIKEAAKKAITDGLTKYTPIAGTPALKNAIVQKFHNENNLSYEPKQILVSCGAKHSIFNLTQAILNPGDEVLIPAPFWVSYPEIVLMAGGIPVILRTSLNSNLKITPQQLQAAITDKTRLIILNSPSNPTGMAYSYSELQALAAVLREYPNILIMTDDIYEHILWNHTPFTNILNVAPDFYERTIVINGVSKAYAMTGWRIGYAAGPEKIISAMSKVQTQSTSNPCSISQAASAAALTGDQTAVHAMCQAFHARHDYVLAALQSIPDMDVLAADGTFYLFPSIQKFMNGFKDDIEFSEHLLTEAKIAVVPGSAFGAPGHIRLSIADSMDNLTVAMERLEQLLKS